jgi:hypothetical protein
VSDDMVLWRRYNPQGCPSGPPVVLVEAFWILEKLSLFGLLYHSATFSSETSRLTDIFAPVFRPPWRSLLDVSVIFVTWNARLLQGGCFFGGR